ncbi:MAG: PilZ domain-containing protein [Acidobacteriota bacterium]
MASVAYPIERRFPRYQVKMQVEASGIDRNGHHFSVPAETLNGSEEGMGLLLDREPDPSVPLLIFISSPRRFLHLQTEIRHVTRFDEKRNLVGVRFLEITASH